MKLLFSVVVTLLLIQGCSSNPAVNSKKKISTNTSLKNNITNQNSIKAKSQIIYSLGKQKKKTEKKRTTVKKKTYTCSNISKLEAYSLMRSGHSYLDRDGDGHPCEWGKKKISRSSTSVSRSNCHYVSGYYRKSGTYVRGHRRCR